MFIENVHYTNFMIACVKEIFILNKRGVVIY